MFYILTALIHIYLHTVYIYIYIYIYMYIVTHLIRIHIWKKDFIIKPLDCLCLYSVCLKLEDFRTYRTSLFNSFIRAHTRLAPSATIITVNSKHFTKCSNIVFTY